MIISVRMFRLNYNIEKRAEYRFNQDILDLINPYYDYKIVAQLNIDIFFDFLFSAIYDDKRIGLFFCYLYAS